MYRYYCFTAHYIKLTYKWYKFSKRHQRWKSASANILLIKALTNCEIIIFEMHPIIFQPFKQHYDVYCY